MHCLPRKAYPISISYLYTNDRIDITKIPGSDHHPDTMEKCWYDRYEGTGAREGEVEEEEKTTEIQGVQICDTQQGGTVLVV